MNQTILYYNNFNYFYIIKLKYVCQVKSLGRAGAQVHGLVASKLLGNGK
jgi:hypothetical protein